MNKEIALSIYHRLPPSSRSFVASVRGYYLNWWRYDRQTEALVGEILERDWWTDTQWAYWVENRLGYILERAATRVPFYRKGWEERMRLGDAADWGQLKYWSVLEKAELRRLPKLFVADDCNPSKMFHDHTSGTTGSSLEIWLKRETVKLWYAMFEARCRVWYGLSRRDRWAMIGGQLVTPASQRTPPFWVWNAGLNQLYMSAYHLSPFLIGSYLDALSKYRIKYILGYPSAIYSLARSALDLGRKDLAFVVAITNAEPLFEHQREVISEAFSCPVRETYGMAEAVAAASECENGRLHQWPEAGVVETDFDTQDLICTGLVNPDMPLIRYRIGDRAEFSTEACSCGRNLPVIRRIDGRSDDVLLTADGRRIGRLDPIFKGDLGIDEAQIIQESLTSIIVKIVPGREFDLSKYNILKERIRERLGEMSISIEEVSEIPRTNRGKFRAVICNLPKASSGSRSTDLNKMSKN